MFWRLEGSGILHPGWLAMDLNTLDKAITSNVRNVIALSQVPIIGVLFFQLGIHRIFIECLCCGSREKGKVQMAKLGTLLWQSKARVAFAGMATCSCALVPVAWSQAIWPLLVRDLVPIPDIRHDLSLALFECILLTSLVMLKCGSMSQQLLNVIYATVSIMMALLLSPLFLEAELLPQVRVWLLASTWFWRLPLVAMTDSVLLTFLCNGLCHLAFVWSEQSRVQVGLENDRDFFWAFGELTDQIIVVVHARDQAMYGHLMFMFNLFDVAVCISSCLVCGWFGQAMRHVVAQAVETAGVKMESQACVSLLSTICDAHVFLDSQLRLVKDEPSLGAMLLRSQRNKDTEFVKLLATAEDQTRFEELASRGPEDQFALAHALHLSMRDGVGNVIPVEVFHVRTEDVNSQPRHLVGIREYAEEVRPSQSLASPQLSLPSLPPRVAVEVQEEEAGSDSSNSTAGTQASLEEAWVLIDAAEGLQILGASRVFMEKTEVQFDDGSHFIDMVAEDERNFFMSAFLQKFEAAVADNSAEFLLSFTASLPAGPFRTRWRFRPEVRGDVFLVRGILKRLKLLSKLKVKSPRGRKLKKTESVKLEPLAECVGRPLTREML